ncbi:MAG: hypothetical protein AAFQ64_13975 [Pseudomonadota bacterium]
MMTISFLVNLLVLAAVIPPLWAGSAGMVAAFGAETPARQILVSIYAAIWLTSALGLALMALGRSEVAVTLAIGLFSVQIVYKTLTAVTVGLGNPVVMTNLPIAALHAATLVVILTRA